MDLHEFVTREHPPHRTLAIALGGLLLVAALLMGLGQGPDNRLGLYVLSCSGIILVVAGLLLPESKLRWLFAVALMVNVASALAALLWR